MRRSAWMKPRSSDLVGLVEHEELVVSRRTALRSSRSG